MLLCSARRPRRGAPRHWVPVGSRERPGCSRPVARVSGSLARPGVGPDGGRAARPSGLTPRCPPQPVMHVLARSLLQHYAVRLDGAGGAPAVGGRGGQRHTHGADRRHLRGPLRQRGVHVVSRQISPPWGSIRFRLALRTYAPWGSSVRVVSQTKLRKIPTRNLFTLLFPDQVWDRDSSGRPSQQPAVQRQGREQAVLQLYRHLQGLVQLVARVGDQLHAGPALPHHGRPRHPGPARLDERGRRHPRPQFLRL